MLSKIERHEIESELKRYPYKRAVLVDALRIVQSYRGWVSDECIRDVAEILDLTAEDVDSVATFYPFIFRKPVGKHVILVCNTISCWIMGYEGILNHLTERLGIKLGETSADGRFTLLPVPCLGVCDYAPAIMVDETLYTGVNPERIDEILESYSEKE